ncbi:ThuA domain-containing protein [Dactylosporangium sp. NPDC049525]|uniref:ThuA domain-containing protein n=1 Tax=Dactylosporangium sp. NPDC049525 TaxID=3154730 RepID=UPI0034261AB5
MILRRLLGVATVTVTLLALAHVPQSQAADTAYDVLVFSKTAGFRHDAIPAGIQAIRDLGAANNFTVTATEDANAFTTGNLAQYEAVVFLSTTGDVLNDAQQTAFESYIRGGGGYAGVHAAADTEYGWSFYGTLVGAYFASHPAIQQVNVRVENRAHAATAHLPQVWTRSDELYNYQTNPRSTARVLATLDESSYSGGTMGADHPITWCKTIDNGRSFYTGLGHTIASYSEANFRNQLLGGIRYAAGKTKADCRPETGYTTLYNGSTTGWSQAGPGSFTNSDATLTSVGGLGMLWYSAKEFRAYSLKLDWRMPGDDNSGVFVGFPASSDPNSAINNGYEVQIDATDTDDRTTGSIYGFKSADLAARNAALNPPGEWNTYELLVEGERLRVYLNGRLINDFTNTVPARSLVQGYIGIQNHGTGDDVSFRNVRIKELAGGDTTPPSVPGNNRVTGTTSNSISLAWNASTDNVGVSGYDVFRENGATDVLVGSPTGTTFTVGSLAAATSYTFYVVAKDAAGNRSGASNAVTAATTGTPSTNLALNKPATADSQCAATEAPAKAVNGTVNGGNADKWCSLGATKWWQVDLGSSQSVSRVVIRHAGAGGENAAWNTRDFDIQVSTNGTTWTTVASPRGNTANVTTHTFAATNARYLRLNVLAPTSNTDAAARIYEFEAYTS